MSGLAWGADDEIAYAISDHGELFQLNLIQVEGEIKNLKLTQEFAWSNESETPYSTEFNDAEGLDILYGNNGISGDAQLVGFFRLGGA